MATPTSSATSASPPMRFAQTNGVAAVGAGAEREERKKAVEKFLARAEVSMVARALRARLSYASYKATHNIPHLPLRDLEAQSPPPPPPPPSRTAPAKRKAATTNHYNNPATQPAAPRRGPMAPPSLSARSHYPATAARTANAAHSLYTSILAQPPPKQARTIHNPADPPLPPPPRPRRPSDHLPPPNPTRSRRPPKSRPDKGKLKERISPSSVLASRDDDMKAAAALTSLLLHSRPSVTASTSSPRSSISAASDTSSTHSFSHFAQSSARTITPGTSAESSFTIPTEHTSVTPPPMSDGTPSQGGMTPTAPTIRPQHAPTDNEAADLMLYLATSPSPARPTTTRDKDGNDMAAYRALGGGAGLRAKGRVLFAGPDAPGSDGVATGARMLTRGGESSFGSSLDSVVDVPMRDPNRLSLTATVPNLEKDCSSTLVAPMEPTIIPPTPTVLTPSQLLPPPPSPPRKRSDHDSSSLSASGSWSSAQAPPTPGNLPFNLNDFINVSPSPAHGGARGKSGLREDVGRKLFEEEQARQIKGHGELPSSGLGIGLGKAASFGEELGGERHGRGGGLGAGIDLIRG